MDRVDQDDVVEYEEPTDLQGLTMPAKVEMRLSVGSGLRFGFGFALGVAAFTALVSIVVFMFTAGLASTLLRNL